MGCKHCGSEVASVAVPAAQPQHYWGRGFWSIIKPLGRALTNLLTNPSFERGIDGWIGSPNTVQTYTGEDAFRGAYSLKLESVNGVTGYGTGRYDLMTQPGETLCVSFWLKSCPGHLVTAYFGYQVLSPGVDQSQFDVDRKLFLGTGKWEEVRLCFSNNSGFAVDTMLTISIGPQSDGCNEAFLDAVTLVAHSEAVSYFDGDQPGASWTGDPHESTSVVDASSRQYGVKVALAELGFNLTGDAGWGMPRVEAVALSYARRPGAHYLRTHVRGRTITLRGTVEGDPCEVHRVRDELVNLFGLWDIQECGEEFLLHYEFEDECGNGSGQVLEIPLSYAGGLEGVRTDLYRQELEIELVANEFPIWRGLEDHCQLLRAGVNVIEYGGSTAAPVVMEMASFSGVSVIRSILNTTNGSNLTLGADGNGVAVEWLGTYMRFYSQPGQLGFWSYPGHVKAIGQIDYSQSKPARWRLTPGRNEIVIDGDPETAVLVCWREHFLSADGVASLTGCVSC